MATHSCMRLKIISCCHGDYRSSWSSWRTSIKPEPQRHSKAQEVWNSYLVLNVPVKIYILNNRIVLHARHIIKSSKKNESAAQKPINTQHCPACRPPPMAKPTPPASSPSAHPPPKHHKPPPSPSSALPPHHLSQSSQSPSNNNTPNSSNSSPSAPSSAFPQASLTDPPPDSHSAYAPVPERPECGGNIDSRGPRRVALRWVRSWERGGPRSD